MTNPSDELTDFGFTRVSKSEKTKKVADVFHSVANKYDLMNDLMSFGIHRCWKRFTISLANVKPGQVILDVASGTGDLAKAYARRVGQTGLVLVTDINDSMLAIGRQRLQDAGLLDNVRYAQVNAEQLPFPPDHFDLISIAFGLRNVTQKEKALRAMYQCIKPGGRLFILEFSKPILPGLNKIYDLYSFKLLPKIGKVVAKDEDSYRYLAESIRKHPDQQTLKKMILEAGFDACNIHQLSGGIVALHIAMKY